jgi:hypothetical protein
VLVVDWQLVGCTYLFNILVGLVSFIGLGVSFIGGFVGLGLVSLSGFSGISGLVGRISLVGRIGLDGITSLVGNNGLVGSIKLFKLSELIVKYPIGLIVRISGLVGHNGLIGRIVHNGLVIIIGLGIVGFVGLSLDSLGGLIGHISLVGRCIIGLIESAASSNHWPIGLIGVIGLCLIASSASAASLAHRLISFVGLIGSSAHRLFCECLATAVNEVTKITWRLKQAAALGVLATLRSSATKTAASTYYFTISSLHMNLLVREKMCWWLALARKKMWGWIGDCLFWRILSR